MNLDSNSDELLFDICSKEINKIHVFFEEWYKGNIKNDATTFSYLENTLSDNFFLISPNGVVLDKMMVLDMIKENYNKYHDNENSFKIWIKNITLKFIFDPIIVLTYEEWQKIPNKTTSRLSSVTFNLKFDNLDNESGFDINWLFVHEVWISNI
ncbi:MAG: hypothetical protein ACW981_10325 [Candidatus Hodarchaeales archaeon]|jgi:hypothetical protein